MERVLNIKELSSEEREEILAYQTYLMERTNKPEANDTDVKISATVNIAPESEQEIASQEGTVMFELLGEYEYPVREIEPKRKEGQENVCLQAPRLCLACDRLALIVLYQH